MSDTLIQAYIPLLVWPSVGFLLLFILPEAVPRFLGRSLYWVGVPLEIFALARQTSFNQEAGLSPLFTVGVLLGGIPLAWVIVQSLRNVALNNTTPQSLKPALASTVASREVLPESSSTSAPESVSAPFPDALKSLQETHWEKASFRGSFILSSVLGNTGFVGLAIAPLLVSDDYLGWIVFYSVTHNVVGTYGLGVFLASYYGRSQESGGRWQQVKDVLTVPSLWAFIIGITTRSWAFPEPLEAAIHGSVGIVIPAALLLMGMRISQIRGWQSLKLGLVPATLKSAIVPLIVGAIALLIGLSPEPRLALVIMAGMPTAFAGLILAEEYELDRELIAGSIVLSTALLLITIPIWLVLFGDHISPSG